MKRLNILTWPIHGSYFNNLARTEHNWYVPVKEDRGQEGYGGRGWTFDLPDYVVEVPAEQVRDLDLDLILFQTPRNYHEDQHEILSGAQRRLPRIYLEHNTPRPHPTDTRHYVEEPDVLVVHVTRYNQLMWDTPAPNIVIEHSVSIDPQAQYRGALARGITVCNGMQKRPRISGYDLFLQARQQVALDAAGMQTEQFGGLGDIPYRHLHQRMADYRFLYSPMRYTSLPLAVIEAMTIGMPVVALATTELPSVIEQGVHGYLSCDPQALVGHMRALLDDPALARRLGANARELARERFGLERFVRDWNAAFARVCG
jgi:hypothetical protein